MSVPSLTNICKKEIVLKLCVFVRHQLYNNTRPAVLHFQSDLRGLGFRYFSVAIDNVTVILSHKTTKFSPFQVSEGPSSLSHCTLCGPDVTSSPAEEETLERDYLVADGRGDK